MLDRTKVQFVTEQSNVPLFMQINLVLAKREISCLEAFLCLSPVKIIAWITF
jgi:hypothetical protein